MTFDSNNIIVQHISEANLRTYYVGFDFKRYRNDELTDKLMDTIVDFAFGYHTGILKQYNRRKLIEAAKSIYKIKAFQETKKIYLDDDAEIHDCELKIEDKYLKRGEFGEMLLHLILRDFFETVPLLSKIHFKDTDSATVHGFDIIHIGPDPTDPNLQTLYLGESKLYSRKDGKSGESGIDDLIEDIKHHFKMDFLMREIALITKKKDAFESIETYGDTNTIEEYQAFLTQKQYWFGIFEQVESGNKKLQDFFKSITIPLICTYQSSIFDGITDETSTEFTAAYETEVKALKLRFDDKIKAIEAETGEPVKTNLNIVLVLFPVPSKKQLVGALHHKLNAQQNA